MAEPTIFIVDNDPGERQLVSTVLTPLHLRTEEFSSGKDFLAAMHHARSGCVVLKYCLPDQRGTDVQAALQSVAKGLPVIMLSNRADVRLAVEVMKAGAADFLLTPINVSKLRKAVELALATEAAQRAHHRKCHQLRERLSTLTDNEREVLDLLAQGMLNKQIAAKLEVSLRTVSARRAGILQKMGVSSLRTLLQSLARLQDRESPAAAADKRQYRLDLGSHAAQPSNTESLLGNESRRMQVYRQSDSAREIIAARGPHAPLATSSSLYVCVDVDLPILTAPTDHPLPR